MLHTLADGLHLGDPSGGTLADGFEQPHRRPAGLVLPGHAGAARTTRRRVTRRRAGQGAASTRGSPPPTPPAASPSSPPTGAASRRICNNLKLGELADNRYVLTIATMLVAAGTCCRSAPDGLQGHVPGARAARAASTSPNPAASTATLQNLIIAVFALEQQLAWYEQGGKIEVGVRAAGDATSWSCGTRRCPPRRTGGPRWPRARACSAEAVPEWRSPGIARRVRRHRPRRTPASTARRPSSWSSRWSGTPTCSVSTSRRERGRLATARRVGDGCSRDLAREGDDVVVIRVSPTPRSATVDDQAAGAAFKQAAAVEHRAGRDTRGRCWRPCTADQPMASATPR